MADGSTADPPAFDDGAPQRARVSQAIAVGAEFNSFRWWWKQALLVRDPESGGERTPLFDAPPSSSDGRPPSRGAGVLDSFRELLGRVLWSTSAALTIHGGNLMLHSLRGTSLAPDFRRAVIHTREELLAAVDVSGLLREQVFEGFDD